MSLKIHNPKLNKTLMRDFSNKKLNISKTAINLILHLTPYIDRDGRIHLDAEHVRKQLVLEHRSFNRAIDELCRTTYNGKKLLTYENGYYVSHFHVSTNGETTYLKHLPFYNEPDFFNLTKNQTRLFLYVATLNVYNQYTKVAIENLYKNKLHDLKFGMHVYDDYKSMTDDLFYLIEKELIHVRLPEESSHIDKNDPNYKENFHSYFGYTGKKKSRTSKYQKKNHVIGLKVNLELYNKNAVDNIASEAEIRLLADRHHMFHEDMKADTFNYFTGKKKKLIEQFGLPGLQIYRSSLEKYFKEKNENILYYDLLDKAENHFTDFYLLEEIKKVILAAINSELGSKGAIAATGYSFTQNNIPLLVEFFIANSGEEMKVLIDQDIQQIKDAHELMSGLSAEDPWTSLQESIELVYSKHMPSIKYKLEDECKKNGITYSDDILNKINSKELIATLAKGKLLSQQSWLDEESDKIKQIVRFFRKKHMPFGLKLDDEPKIPITIPLYNWLEE